jgi:hypothetical protein
MTKAPWLHYENSNACMTKAEEVIAVEHKEKKEGNNKAIISYIYHSLHSNEVLCKTLTTLVLLFYSSIYMFLKNIYLHDH